MSNLIRKTFESVETKEVNDETRTLVVQISTSSPDRSNDVVLPSGVKLDNYLKNPVVAAFHRYDQPAIGRTIEISKTGDGIVAKVEFAPKGVNPMADMLFELYKNKFQQAWSIGFIPKKWSQRGPNWTDGMEFQETELLEYSAVLVPDNPEALTLLSAKGFNTKMLEQEMTQFQKQSEENNNETLPRPELAEDAPKEGDDGWEERQPGDSKEDVLPENRVEIPQPNTAEAPEIPAEDQEKSVEDIETKEGRVLSEKNRKLISTTISDMKTAIESLEKLVVATDSDKEDQKDLNNANTGKLVKVLRDIDKTIGVTLRDHNKTSGQVPDESNLTSKVIRVGDN